MADISKLFATASLKVEIQGVGEIELVLKPPDPIELASVGMKFSNTEPIQNLESIVDICAKCIVDWRNVEYEGRPIAPTEKIGGVEAVKRVLKAVSADGRLVLNHVIEAISDTDFFLKSSGERLAS